MKKVNILVMFLGKKITQCLTNKYYARLCGFCKCSGSVSSLLILGGFEFFSIMKSIAFCYFFPECFKVIMWILFSSLFMWCITLITFQI